VVSEATIRTIAERLGHAAPEATIILFGSHARGDAREGSDLDILVVQPAVESRFAEAVRLGDEVGDLGVPVDILVTTEAVYAKWSGEPCTVYHEAARDGRLLHAPERAHRAAAPQSV
jgi:uncharacterized protein